MKKCVLIDANKEWYSLDGHHDTLTAGDIIEHLQQYDEDTPVFIRNDGGFTYGAIRYDGLDEAEVND